MKGLRLFRVPRHSRYTYIPRFYDPDKEALEERLREIDKQKHDTPEAMKARIAAGLKRGRGDMAYRQKAVRKSNMTLFITIGILILMSIIFIYFGLPSLIELIES